MPSSTAARVAWSASSTRAFFSFISVFSGRAHFDHRDAARELRQALLELLAIVIGGGLIDLGAQGFDAALDVLLLAGAVDDGGVVLVHRDALGLAQILQPDALELNTGFLEDRLAAGQDRDILEHRFAAIASETRSLHRASIQESRAAC